MLDNPAAYAGIAVGLIALAIGVAIALKLSVPKSAAEPKRAHEAPHAKAAKKKSPLHSARRKKTR